MRIVIVDNGTDDIDSVKQLVAAAGYAHDTVAYTDIAAVDMSSYDVAFLTGGVWYDDDSELIEQYGDELALIASAPIPIVAVCLGFLLAMRQFGETISELGDRRNGMYEVQLTDSGSRAFGTLNTLFMFENHTRAVTQVVGSDLEVLATSPECIEIVRHISLPIVAAQFHPERLDNLADSVSVFQALIRAATGDLRSSSRAG